MLNVSALTHKCVSSIPALQRQLSARTEAVCGCRGSCLRSRKRLLFTLAVLEFIDAMNKTILQGNTACQVQSHVWK